MAGWIGTEFVYWKPEPIPGYPTWEDRDCGCCGGISWGGEYPAECSRCKGRGSIAVHLPSGTVAEYPGGPLLGAHRTASER